jgi:hypothetical protein
LKLQILSKLFPLHTVIIFLARNGRTRAVKFRPKNFGRISFDLGEISPNQQILRLSNGRKSPKMGEFRPKFLRANLNCADSPILNKFRPKKKLLCTKAMAEQAQNFVAETFLACLAAIS